MRINAGAGLAIFLCLVCLFGLVACGEKGRQEESFVYYDAEYAEGAIRGEILQFHFGGGVLYRSEREGSVSKLYRCGAEGLADELVFALEKGESLLDFAVLSDGRIAAMVSRSRDTGNGQDTQADEKTFVVRIYDAAGKALETLEVPDMDGSHAFARMRATEDDGVLLALGDGACMLRLDGSVQWMVQKLDFFVTGLYAMEDGTTLLSEFMEQGTGIALHKVSARGEITRQVGTLPSYVQLVDCERGIYAIGTGSLCRVEETGNRIEVLGLAAQGISGANVRSVSKTGDSYQLCLYDSNNAGTFQMVALKEKEGAIEKKVLSIALLNNLECNTPMGNFNMKSKTHRVVGRTYSDDYNTKIAQIDASLLTQDAPDLISIDSLEKYEDYARKGALCDVTELVPREDYLERTLNDLSVDGKIYGFPYRFNVSTIYAPVDVLKGRDTWSTAEFMDFMEEHPNAFMEPDITAERGKRIALYFALCRGIYEFVDFGRGSASFDSDAFRSLLERTGNLKVTSVSATRMERSLNGEEILWVGNICLPSDMEQFAAIIGNGREFTLIGYPDGKNGSGGLINYGTILGINGKTKEVDAAKEFFEEWLRFGDTWSKYWIPVTKNGYEDAINRAKEVKYKKDAEGNLITDENGNPVEEPMHYGFKDSYRGIDISYEVYALTEKQEKMLRDAVDSAVASTHGENTIINIILEEADAYFAGSIGLEDTIDKIQNRAQLYLNERK